MVLKIEYFDKQDVLQNKPKTNRIVLVSINPIFTNKKINAYVE
jgi:hypothetical protein